MTLEGNEQIVQHMIHSEGVEQLKPLKVELSQNSRGYTFSVAFRGDTIEEVRDVIEETAHEMRDMIRRLEALDKEEEG